MISPALLGFYCLNILFLPLLLIGVIRSGKARLQNRRGPSIVQPLWDIAKLFGKDETVSRDSSWAFRIGPLLSLSAIATVALTTPWLTATSPLPGDLFLMAYLFALGKFASGLAALDSGSPFGALGASREVSVSLLVEPTVLLALAALAVRAHTSALSAMFASASSAPDSAVSAGLVAIALSIAAVAELSRMPVDDPTTHLELTMIHEACHLENSGRNLALVECASALKTAILFGLICRIVLSILPAQPPAIAYLSTLGALVAAACLLVVAESVLVRLRWRRIPNFLAFGAASAVLACLVAAMRG